jgi:hypothetical protein
LTASTDIDIGWPRRLYESCFKFKYNAEMHSLNL